MEFLKEYAKMVKNMRKAQTDFFINSSSPNRDFYLNQTKAMERMVDRVTEDVLKPDPQGKLF